MSKGIGWSQREVQRKSGGHAAAYEEHGLWASGERTAAEQDFKVALPINK